MNRPKIMVGIAIASLLLSVTAFIITMLRPCTIILFNVNTSYKVKDPTTEQITGVMADYCKNSCLEQYHEFYNTTVVNHKIDVIFNCTSQNCTCRCEVDPEVYVEPVENVVIENNTSVF